MPHKALKAQNPMLAFSFMARGYEAGLKQNYFEFEISGEADALAIIRLKSGPGADDCNYVVLMPHELPGQFNVMACSKRGKSVHYSFTHVEDRLALGEHFKTLGVPDHVIAQWNEAKPAAAIQLADGATAKEAAADIARIMKKAKGVGSGPNKA